jgi:hypothetical protein
LVKPSNQKYFAFPEGQISANNPANPARRGASAIVTNVGPGGGGRFRRQVRFIVPDENAEADGEVVWSWRRDAGVKFVGSKLLRDDGDKKARSPGRARYKP